MKLESNFISKRAVIFFSSPTLKKYVNISFISIVDSKVSDKISKDVIDSYNLKIAKDQVQKSASLYEK